MRPIPLLALSLLLAACGGGGSPAAAPPGPDSGVVRFHVGNSAPWHALTHIDLYYEPSHIYWGRLALPHTIYDHDDVIWDQPMDGLNAYMGIRGIGYDVRDDRPLETETAGPFWMQDGLYLPVGFQGHGF